MSVAMIAAYLAFFPVAVGALRGLQSPAATQVELMRAYAGGVVADPGATAAAGQRAVPAAGAAAGRRAAVIGAIVAEVSIGRGAGSAG